MRIAQRIRNQEEQEMRTPWRSSIPTADPNEPVYCTCRRVSFGQMVGCDNDDCLTEWFHFGCVGLTEEPSKWYCPDCTAKGFSI